MNPNQPGCYLIHWQPAIGNLSNPRGTASHYLGSTKKPVGDRLREHQSKVGARITKAAVEQGRELVRTWRGGRSRERKLKKLHNNRLLCPICNPRRSRGCKPRKSRTHKSCEIALGKD
jgi:putative endonuclease